MALGKHFPRVRFGTGLVAYYNLKTGFYTANKVFDYSRKGNTGTVSGTSCLPKYPGFNFDGSKDYIAVADADSLEVSAVTLSAWVNLDSSWSAAGYIVAKMEDWASAGGNGEAAYALSIASTRKPLLSASADGNRNTAELADDAISKSVWHHIVGTYEYTGGAPYYKLYVDGALVSSNGWGNAGGTIYNTGTGRLTMGARYDLSVGAYNTFFIGKISDVMVYKKVLTATEIKGLYRQTKRFYVR